MSSDATSHNQTDASQTAVCYLGSCLCGQIAFKIVGQPKFVTLCHCSHCSKWTGSGFAWNAAFTPEQFSFTKGETLHRVYVDSKTTSGGALGRGFCSNCGSHTMNVGTLPNGSQIYAVPAGTIDGDVSESWKPQMELFCRSRASWLPDTGLVRNDTVPYQALAAQVSGQ